VLLRQGLPIEELTIVLDEAPDLADEVSGTGDLIRKLGQMGRDLKMRMLVLSTSELVGDLGLKGRGRARANYAWVSLQPAVQGQRSATLAWGTTESDLDLKLTWSLAQQAHLADRGWSPPAQRGVIVDDGEDDEMVSPVSPLPRAVRFRGETPISETRELPEYIVATPETARNALLQEMDDETPNEMAVMGMAVARMVAAKKCSETEGIRIVFGANPGSSVRYQSAQAALKAAQQELRLKGELV
jgi:hypothetical protein